MNWLNSNKAEYFVQSLFCTCQLINLTDKDSELSQIFQAENESGNIKENVLCSTWTCKEKKMHGHISSVLQV